MIFKNRQQAGQILATKLTEYMGQPDLVVLALPRGGVPVAFEVAKALGTPLDVFIVRKLGLPDQPELAMGAIATGGITSLNKNLIEKHEISQETIDKIIKSETAELSRREKAYMPAQLPHLSRKNVILVDDGLAIGSTMGAAVAALRQSDCAKLTIAAPVGSPEACELFKLHADKIVVAQMPKNFSSVGEWYEDFTQTTDDQVRNFLQLSRKPLVNDVA